MSKNDQREHMTLCASNESLALCLSGSKIFMISKESSINSNSLQQLNIIPISQREHMTLCIECITFTLFMLCYFHWDSVYYSYLKSFNLPLEGGGAYKVLNYHITVDFFENYCNTLINFLYKYHHRRIFYQKMHFPITVR